MIKNNLIAVSRNRVESARLPTSSCY